MFNHRAWGCYENFDSIFLGNCVWKSHLRTSITAEVTCFSTCHIIKLNQKQYYKCATQTHNHFNKQKSHRSRPYTLNGTKPQHPQCLSAPINLYSLNHYMMTKCVSCLSVLLCALMLLSVWSLTCCSEGFPFLRVDPVQLKRVNTTFPDLAWPGHPNIQIL